MARQFVLPLRGIGTPIKLNDLVAGRWDLVCRCTCNAMLVSDGVRTDTKLQLVLSNDAPAGTDSSGSSHTSVCVEVDGARAENLRPDERHLASLLQWLLDPPRPSARKVYEYRRHHPGVHQTL